MKLKQLGINKSCWFFHNIWWKICLKKIFLSCVWFFEPRRYPANWAKHFPSTAQLAGYLLRSKNYAYEKKKIFKQSFYQILWKDQQLLLIPSCFNFIPYPPYCHANIYCLTNNKYKCSEYGHRIISRYFRHHLEYYKKVVEDAAVT